MMMNIKLNRLSVIIAGIIFYAPITYGEIFCRPYEIIEEDYSGSNKFGSGLLWKISRDDTPSGYVFGTIHIDDKQVLDIPEPVLQSLKSSDNFLMEVVPESDDVLEMSMTMFFMDGTRLNDVINKDVFNDASEILDSYGFTREMVSVMKPWAAYIVMSYPQSSGDILDFKLLKIARENGANVFGLETAMEQVNIFAQLAMSDQVRLLTDTVCHYDVTTSDFEEIKEHYLNRDLDSLYSFSKRYTFGDDSVYEHITDKLVNQRNRRMVKNILNHFNSGVTFVAVGAMHLPGEDGILNLLELQDYQIDRIY